jgi:hypothetical protein
MSVPVAAPSPVRRGPLAVSYLILVLVPALAIVFALQIGSGIPPAAVEPSAQAADPVAIGGATAHASMPRIGLLLAQILVVLVATRACGLALRLLGQPQVVGEMLAGLLLGPSFLGWLLPGPSAALFPAASLGFLS